MIREDLIGKKFNRLTVIKHHHVNNVWQHFWECICDCGNISVVHGSKLRSGKTKSCGCLITERTPGIRIGNKRTSEYTAWSNMIQRCTNPKNNNYKYYGFQGTKVCDRWRYSFELFLGDMGFKPSTKHSIERKDNDGGYEPDNCIWDIRRNQDRNKSANKRLEYVGRSQIIKDWADELHVSTTAINWHLSQGKEFNWVYNYFKNKKK